MPPDNTDDGLRAAIEIRDRQPDVGVLVLAQHTDERYALDLIGDSAEGVGYLLKDRVADFAGFADAVRHVGAGGSVLDPTVVSRMLGRRRRDDPLEAFTAREREVLEVMAEGRSNRGIAEVLVVTPHAVDKHMTSIFSKLGRRRGAARSPPRARGARVPQELTGIRARTSVPRPGGLSSSIVPSSAPTRSSRPRRPLPRSMSAPPAPSSATGAKLVRNDRGSALIVMNNARPGQTASSCVTITYRGSKPVRMKLYGARSGSGLDQYVELTVTRGTSRATTPKSCAGFSADRRNYRGFGNGVVFKGLVSQFPKTWSAASYDPAGGTAEKWTKGEARAFRFHVRVVDNQAAMGLWLTQKFSWQVRSIS